MPLRGAVHQVPPTSADLARILGAGLAVMPLCEVAEPPTGELSEQMGYNDALSSAQTARGLGLPPGLTIWLEHSSGVQGVAGPDAALSAYVSGWARGVKACGYDAGLFASSSINLSNLEINRLCQLSSAVAEPMLGFSMRQVALAIPGLERYSQPASLYQILADRRSSTPAWLIQQAGRPLA